MHSALVWPILLVVLGSGEAPGKDGGGWVGMRVVLKSGETPLLVGNAEVVERNDIHRIYRVERFDGPWLWLASGGVTGKTACARAGVNGWVKASAVVPYDEAIAFFTGELQAHPAPGAFIRRAYLWYDKQEFERALADLDEAIRLDPKNAAAHIWRGNTRSATRELDKALADYDEAIRLDPAYPVTYFDRALVWFHKRELDKALADYDEAIRLDPRFAMAHAGRAWAWTARKDLDKALTDYDEAIRLDPKYAPAFVGRAGLFSRKRDYGKALADYAEATALDPGGPSGYLGQALLRASCPDPEYRDGPEAIDAATRACELSGWKEPGALDKLAAAHAESGDFEAAVKWQKKALERAPAGNANAKARKEAEARLELYRAERPYRLPQ